MWVPCGVEGVRGSQTGLPIYVPLGPPRPAHREPLWWLGARLGVFQVFQEPQKVSSVALLLLSTGYVSISHSIWQPCVERRHETCPRMLQVLLLASVFFFFFFQPLSWLWSNRDGCDFNKTLHMACGSASSVFYSMNLPHQLRSDVTNSKVLSSSDVVVFRGG